MVSALHLVALGHPSDAEGLHELLLALGRCSSRARSVAGSGTTAAPLAVRATRSSVEALTLLQGPEPCAGLIMSHHFALPGPDSEELMRILTQRHPLLPIVCWGDFSRVNMEALNSCHVMLSWEKSAGPAPLVAVLRMLEAGDIRPSSRIKVSKAPSGDKDDLLVIPVMGLGIPPFYWPSDSRMPESVDVGDVHIPLGQGAHGRSSSSRAARVSNGGGGRGAGGKEGRKPPHRSRLAFFFATESERTKMLLEEMKELREQERESRRGAAAGQLPQGRGSSGGVAPDLERVSTSSSACWNGIGAGSGPARQAAGRDGALTRLMAAAFDDDASSVTSLSSFMDVRGQSTGQAQGLQLWPQDAEAGRPSWSGAAGQAQAHWPQDTGRPAWSGDGSWSPPPVTASDSGPRASHGARNAAAQEVPASLAPETGGGHARNRSVSGSGIPPEGGAGVSRGDAAPPEQRLQHSATVPGLGQGSGSTAAASVRCGSPQAAAQQMARELQALHVGFPLSPLVRELVMEVEQLRRLVQVKRALEKLEELAEGVGSQEEEGGGAGDVGEQSCRNSAEQRASPTLLKV